jgi:hypothetical protein
MTINDVHNTIQYIVNKDQNQSITHAEIDLILDKAQLVLFNQYHTNPKMPAQAQAARYGESQRIDDSLSAFKSIYTFATGDTPSGVLTLPGTYMHLISLHTTTYNNQLGRNVTHAVQILSEEELSMRLESQVIPLDDEEPVAIMYQSSIKMYPTTTKQGQLFYFRRPAVPVFGYTSSGRTATYNSGTSTQLEWKDYDIMNIISIALTYIGINMSSADVTQFAQLKSQEGQ